MTLYTIPTNQIEEETLRVNSLDSYQILDTLPEKEYDDITKLASFICGTPVSLIALMDEERNWYKSIHGDAGMNVREMPREISFCKITIQGDHLYEIPDLTRDELFSENPLVTERNVRFYAGYPLINSEGFRLGTLCVVDFVPRKLDTTQREALRTLANQVITNFELRRQRQMLEQKNMELEDSNARLSQFARLISHDLKSPLQSIKSLYELMRIDPRNEGEYKGKIDHYIKRMSKMIDGLLAFAKNDLSSLKKELTKIEVIVSTLMHQFESRNVQIDVVKPLPEIETESVLLELVFQNLISNAIKYGDKETTRVSIGCEGTTFFVKDNGPGIAKEHHQQIFEPFTRFNERKVSGYGIGLYTIKTILDHRGSKIWLESIESAGTTFYFDWVP